MGLVNAQLTMRNPRKPELTEVSAIALADTGSVHLCIPDHIRIQLELDEIDKKEIILFTKSDLLETKEIEKKIKKMKKTNPEVLTVSIHDQDKLEKLKKYLLDALGA